MYVSPFLLFEGKDEKDFFVHMSGWLNFGSPSPLLPELNISRDVFRPPLQNFNGQRMKMLFTWPE